jgi:hypothetical protein
MIWLDVWFLPRPDTTAGRREVESHGNTVVMLNSDAFTDTKNNADSAGGRNIRNDGAPKILSNTARGRRD